MNTRSERNTALLLAATQALYQTASVVMVAVGGLVGLQLAPDARLATLPIGMVMVAATATMIPASLFMQRYGRRAGFLLGSALGASAGVLATLGVLMESFAMFIAANALLGMYGAFAGYYRFAAADAVNPSFRGPALSWVVAGGIVAALLGPAIVRHSDNLAHIGASPFIAPYVAMTLLGLLAIVLVSRLNVPPMLPPTTSENNEARPLAEIMRQPAFITALAGTTVGFAVMVMVMTATPLAMKLCGLPLQASTTVIQWHMLGMFVPAFFTGKLIQRVGVLPVMASGVALLLAHVCVVLSGIAYGNFIAGLIMLGMGWNFLYVGGSTLLTECYRPAERSRTQAAHDFIVYGITSVASLSAGGLLAVLGWQAVNIAVIPALLVVGIAIANLTWKRRPMLATIKQG
ncbi:MAG: MFS transporter [Steroidobacteraceae bacterium]